jgi:hypothetical protein
LIVNDTPGNIKRKYGVGYSLIIESQTNESKLLTGPYMPEQKLDSLILEGKYLHGASKSRDGSTMSKLTYFIPYDQSCKMAQLLE